MALDKGKAKAIYLDEDEDERRSSSSSDSDSGSDSASSSESDSDESVSEEFLDSLLAAATKELSARAEAKKANFASLTEDDSVMTLGSETSHQPLPALDPGPSLPQPYFKLGQEKDEAPQLIYDPDLEGVEAQATNSSIHKTLPPQPDINPKTGKPFTKMENKALKESTAGAKWFDLPKPAEADLPRLSREVDAMRLRNALDPKRFYRKEDTKKGPLPKYFALGHIIPDKTPFGAAARGNLPKAVRKGTIVDEIMADDEARTYAKRKFSDLQTVRGNFTRKRPNGKRSKKW